MLASVASWVRSNAVDLGELGMFGVFASLVLAGVCLSIWVAVSTGLMVVELAKMSG